MYLYILVHHSPASRLWSSVLVGGVLHGLDRLRELLDLCHLKALEAIFVVVLVLVVPCGCQSVSQSVGLV